MVIGVIAINVCNHDTTAGKKRFLINFFLELKINLIYLYIL